MTLTLEQIRDRCRIVDDCWVWATRSKREAPYFYTHHDGRSQCHSVRRIVLSVTQPRANTRRHLAVTTCGTAHCCRPEHLKWVTYSTVQRAVDRPLAWRVAHAARTTRNNPGTKLSLESARAIRLENPMSAEDRIAVAQKFGCSESSIEYVINHRRWIDPALVGIINQPGRRR